MQNDFLQNDDNREKEPSKMPYMCPMMYYGTYPVPMPQMSWPPDMRMMYGMNNGQDGYGTYPMRPWMYGPQGGYFGIPFPESQE